MEYTYDIFISKESKDYIYAKHVFDSFTKKGLNVFLSEVSLPEMGRDEFQHSLESAVASSKTLILLCSAESGGSKWVEHEVDQFLYLKRTKG